MMNNEDNPKFWENIYKNDDAGWDLGGPTPVFVNISSIIKPKNLCIIGCGKGYDAVMFAKNNFKVTAVDFAPSAVKSLKTLSKKNKVTINVLEKDIFSLATQYNNSFDYVIEQTCFCAIHPNKRTEYEKLVYRMLKTNGKLIGLWFPLDKDINDGGRLMGQQLRKLNLFLKMDGCLKVRSFLKNL